MLRKLPFFFSLIIVPITLQAHLPELTPEIANKKLSEIITSHAAETELNGILVERALKNYLERLDPTKSYFIASDIAIWTTPSQATLNQLLLDYQNHDYKTFRAINKSMRKAIRRRRKLEKTINLDNLPENVDIKAFRDMDWLATQEELADRISRIWSLQLEAAAEIDGETHEKSLQRIRKPQLKNEEELLNKDPRHEEKLLLSNMLKATASALDSQTAYFTPGEATDFLIAVQQQLLGIGVQLRDDISGFTITRILDGGPAAEQGLLQENDRIVAVNGEPVVGMDIRDGVSLIRGPKGTNVLLTIIRKEDDTQEKLDISVPRDKVILKESRYESAEEPFASGTIAYLRLHSFYQDKESSSAEDLKQAFEELKKDDDIKGLVLDLRYNSGGMLSQAVAVTGLFITKGIVVSIKDNSGKVQHLRDIDGKRMWDGPLVVLVNRGSASASEIVAQTLKDYGRAIIVGDDRTYGKGSFQTFTLNANQEGTVNPEGEYKVTQGRYYTVSGTTPQLTGVASDIVVPGILSESEIGEQFSKYPLPADKISANFEDDLSDIPFLQRSKVRMLYHFDLQPRLNKYTRHLDRLKRNSEKRLASNKNYQAFLEELKKDHSNDREEDKKNSFGKNDLQLHEGYNIMKDLILLTSN